MIRAWRLLCQALGMSPLYVAKQRVAVSVVQACAWARTCRQKKTWEEGDAYQGREGGGGRVSGIISHACRLLMVMQYWWRQLRRNGTALLSAFHLLVHSFSRNCFAISSVFSFSFRVRETITLFRFGVLLLLLLLLLRVPPLLSLC